MPLKAIFLDVGGTLVLPDYERTLQPLIARGIRPAGTELNRAEKAAKSALDAQISRTGKFCVDGSYWDNYYTALLRGLEMDDGELKGELISLARTSANWNRLADGAQATLRELGRQYRLGVISNSDGGILELLTQLRIHDLFQCVTDSGIVGHEKPEARIFLAAIEALGVPAHEAVYVGDIYSVDYMGAKAVGMKAILMDAAGVYRDEPVERIESWQQLPERVR
jgi:HAD superfamily hydrolase (TIGR01509 family)